MTALLLACATHHNEWVALLRDWGGWVFFLVLFWLMFRD